MKKNILVLMMTMVFAFSAAFIGCKKEEAAAPEKDMTMTEEKKEEMAAPAGKMDEAKKEATKMMKKAMPKM